MSIRIERYVSMITMLMFALCAASQSTDRDCLRLGNKFYREGLYSRAETYYRKALDKTPTLEAYYNIGNSLVMQGKDSTAFEMFKEAVEMPSGNKLKKAHAFHNMGNLMYASCLSLLKSQNAKDARAAILQAVEYYKSSLRCNPTDNETRYNLAKALYLLNLPDMNDSGSDTKQDDKKEEQQQNNKPEKNQSKNDEDKKEKSKVEEKPEDDKNNISDEAAEQLLNSALQDEKNVQRKINKNTNNKRRSLDKDW